MIVKRLLPAAFLLLFATRVWAGKVEDLVRMLEDPSYKVRVQAALVLGKLGDRGALDGLAKALGDPHKTVRAMAAQSLGRLGDRDAVPALEGLLKKEQDGFVRTQASKALATLGGSSTGGLRAGERRAKIYLTFGSFSGGSRAADPAVLEALRGALRRELGKLSSVTFQLTGPEEKNFGKTGLLGFLIDGNVTRLDEANAGGATETNCDVKVMVARWPSKSIILWTNAGAAVQGGSRPEDRQGARRECLEASAGQLGEDLLKFFASQGG